MKSRNQSGSAHLVIIIALVVVVLGALGFIFWQNFVNKKTDNQVANQTDSSANSTATKFKTPLVVTEWNVKGDLGDSLAVNYVIKNDTSDENSSYFVLKTNEVDCGSWANGTGRIVRLTSSQKVPYAFEDKTAAEAYDSSSASSAHIGDYYYYFQGPTGVCEVDGVDYTETVAKSLETATKNLVRTLVVN